jgi:hypothetical protein
MSFLLCEHQCTQQMGKRKLPELKPLFEKLPPIESKYLSRIPCILSATGSTGLGKSHFTLGLIKLLRREGSITKLYVFCPTVKSSSDYSAVLKETDWIFEDIMNAKASYAAIDEVEKDCQAIAEGYAEELEWTLAVKQFKAGDSVDSRQEHLLEQYGYEERIPKRPAFAVLLDDCAHSPLLARHTNRLNKFPNFVLKSRHVGLGLGCSIFMVGQDTRCIPSILRKNATHMVAWHSANEAEIKNLWLDSGCAMAYELFKQMFQHYTREKYSYMFIDNIRRTISDSF